MTDEVLRKLEDIEHRLAQIESKRHVIEEERIEIALPGDLESEEMAEIDDATITTKKIPFCECGKKLEEFFLCHICHHKICDGCSVKFRNRYFCSDDLLKRLPITTQGFKVLLLIANRILGENEMHKLTGIPKNQVKEAVVFLKNYAYIETSMFHKKSVTDFGLECLTAWGQIFGGSDDMGKLDRGIRRHLVGY
ncbi:MAG: hypothetical protein WD717_06430 [Nitrosarchaeum sp.]